MPRKEQIKRGLITEHRVHADASDPEALWAMYQFMNEPLQSALMWIGRDFSGRGRVQELDEMARTVLQSIDYDPDVMPPRLREDKTISPIAFWCYRLRQAAHTFEQLHAQGDHKNTLIQALEVGQCYGILLAQAGDERNRSKGWDARREQREHRLELLRKLAEQKYPSADHPRPLTSEQRNRLRIAFAQRHPHDKVSRKRFSGWCEDIGLKAPKKPQKKTI